MKISRRAIFLFTALVISAGTSLGAVSAADNPEETMYPKVKQDAGWMGLTTDNSIDLAQPSRLVAQLYQNYLQPGQKMYLCTSTQSPGCSDLAYSLSFHANFIECSSPVDTDCIEEFGLVNTDGTITDAKFIKEYASSGNYSGDLKIKLPAGHGPGIWSVAEGAQQQQYSVAVGVDGDFIRTSNPNEVGMGGFSAAVQPITEVPGSGKSQDPNPKVMPRGLGDSIGWDTFGIESGCQIFNSNYCALRQSFDPIKRYILKVRLHKVLSGWLHGRMKNATIQMDNSSDGQQTLTIQANSMQVPVVSGWSKWSELPAALQALYPPGSGGTSRNASDFTTTDLGSRTLLTVSQVAGQGAIDELNGWLPLLGNKATNMKSFWTVKTISGQLPFDLSKCGNGKGLTGFIGTNSSTYSDGPPSYDSASGSLNYTVSAPHFDSQGKVFGGDYQLSVRSDIARCIYKFSNAPISAKIEIASSDGTQRVATTSVTENKGWLNLIASGFEFSSPTVKVKLSQDAPAPVATPTPLATPAPTPTASPAPVVVATPTPQPVISTPKKTTITCIKGKTTKIVTALKPTCPIGYKKK